MADSALIKEYQEFSKNLAEIQQQYVTIVNQILPSKDVDIRSLSKVKIEIDSLPSDNVVYHSVGKMFLISDIASTQKMIESSMESNSRAIAILNDKKSSLEKALKEAEEKNNFYLSKIKATN